MSLSDNITAVVELGIRREPTIIEAETPETAIIEVPAMQGPAGPPGSVLLGGVEVELGSLTPGDCLVYYGGKWTNENKTSISDGGNF